MGIMYLKGDATDPKISGKIIIAHICNDIGAWGKGFVLAVSNKWPQVRQAYISRDTYQLGTVQLVCVDNYRAVANMIAQHGIRSRNNPIPLDYAALRNCLAKVAVYARKHNATIHMPRIGCGLAGGEWVAVS